MKRFWLFLFLVFLPTQLGRHFWPPWSKVVGIRVDYLSPTLYFLDILWLLVFIGGWKEIRVNFKKYWWVGIFIVINVMVAEREWLAIYRWLRIFQMGWMGMYLFKNKGMFKKELTMVLPVWIVFESFLGLGQIIRGGSLEGVFYWLGERRFSYSSIGTAQMAVVGRGIVRAYGTFSHPNSMAGFLLVAELLWVAFKTKEKPIWWWMVFWSGLVGIMLSGSRTVWLVSLVALIFNSKFFRPKVDPPMAEIFKQNKRRQWGFGLVLLGMFVVVLAGVGSNYVVADWLGGWDGESFLKRWNLNVAALKIIRDNPLLGVGLGNFLVKLPEYQKNNSFFWLQPVHNCLLLLVSEIGLGGLLIFNFQFSIFNKFHNLLMSKNRIIKSIAMVMLVTGMVDHYWLTLPQNSWLLVVFGVVLLR